MDRLSQAQREAYASADRAAPILWAVIINHPTFIEPIRVVAREDGGELEDVHLGTGVVGPPSPFKACAFQAVPPGVSDDGPTEAQLAVDNVSGLLTEHLELTLDSNLPIEVTFLAYRMDDLTMPGEVIEGFKLRNVALNATSARGTLFLEDLATQAFPRRTYGMEDFPGLWRR